MNLIPILRSEAVCLVVLIFLLYYSSVYSLNDTGRRFRWINIFALGHVIFSVVTIWTVNHLETVPLAVNHVCHVVFYIFAILFSYELLHFVIDLVYGVDKGRRLARATMAIPALYAVAIPFLPIEYVQGNGSNYSYGPCVFAGYACAAVLFMVSMVVILSNMGKVSVHDKRALIPGLIVMTLAILIQAAVPEILFTGGDVTLVTAGIFVAIVDPIGKYRHKAYFDILTGLRNQNCYRDDVDHLQKEVGNDSEGRRFTYILCDINSFKEIRENLGHTVSDEYLRLAAKALRESLTEAYGVYRTGRDEFCAIYLDKQPETVRAEIAKLRRRIGSTKSEHQNALKPFTVSIGYATAARGEGIESTAERARAYMTEEKNKYHITHESPDTH